MKKPEDLNTNKRKGKAYYYSLHQQAYYKYGFWVGVIYK